MVSTPGVEVRQEEVMLLTEAPTLFAIDDTRTATPEALTVTISGDVATSEYGTPVILTGHADEDEADVCFTWFVNGALAGVDTEWITVSGDLPGRYRVDLLAVTDDDARSAVATVHVDIAQPDE